MARKDRRILEEFVEHVCESENMPVIKIRYLNFKLDAFARLVMFVHGFFEHKKELALLFNSGYMYETHYDTILHELGHYEHYYRIGEKEFEAIGKEEREKQAEKFTNEKYSEYFSFYQKLVKKHNPRHAYLKSAQWGPFGLHLWVRGYPDPSLEKYIEGEVI